MSMYDKKPLQYCKVISLQLIKINEKNKKLKIKENKLMYLTSSCHITKSIARNFKNDWERQF